MKSNRTKMLLCLLLFTGVSNVFGQTTSSLSDQEIYRQSFSSINSPQQYNGTLLNRSFSVDQIISEVDGVKATPVSFEDWIDLHESMWFSLNDSDQSQTMSPDDFIVAGRDFFNSQFESGTMNRLPIGIIDCKSTRIIDEAFIENRITEVNGEYIDQGLLPTDFETIEVLAATPLSTGFLGNEVTYVIDEQFLFSNNDDPIQTIQIDFDDDNGYQEVNFGDERTVTYPKNIQEGIFLKGKITYSSGTQKSFTSAVKSILNEFDQIGLGRLLTPTFFDHFGEVSHNNFSLEYGIKLSDCHKGLKKPIFVAHGFLAPPVLSAVAIFFGYAGSTSLIDQNGTYLENIYDVTLWNLYQGFNFSGTIESLREAGHDIVILRLKDRYASLENYGELVTKAIKEVNELKAANQSNYENGAIGYSLGGMALRYALNKMEKDVLSGASNHHHHTRIFSSYDTGHHGNNLPLGIQSGLAYAKETFGTNGLYLHIMHYLLNTNMAKSASIYHYSQSMYTGNHQAPHPLRTSFANLLNNQTHSKTVVQGFPAFSRNIAISQGHRSGNASLYEFQNGGHFYNRNNALGSNADIEVKATGHYIVFSKEGGIFGSNHYHYNNPNTILTVDNAPGSYQFGLYSGAMRGISHAFGVGSAVSWNMSGIDEDCEKKFGGPWSFVPVVSGFALNTSYLGIGRDWIYNLDYHNLMLEEPSVSNSYYGYPVVGHPNDHFNRTPFEALCAIKANSIHIRGNYSGECIYEEPSYIMHQHARNFMGNEMYPDHLKLQNKEIGKNTRPDLPYRADYEAWEKISFGRDVTWATDKEEYIIYDNGHIESKAADAIYLQPGFEVKAGGEFLAEIGEVSCRYKPLETPFGKSLAEDGQENDSSFDKNLSVEQEDTEEIKDQLFSIYPNPSKGVFNIELNSIQNGTITIIDFQGRIVISQSIEQKKTSIDLSDKENGMYIVTIQTADQTLMKRVSKQ